MKAISAKTLIFGLLITCIVLGLGMFVFPKHEEIDFNEKVRPILNQHCLSCHGGVKKSGGLSFLFEQEVFDSTDSGLPAIVRGDARKSEIINRIKHTDSELRMPPEGARLSKTEIETLEKWINQGAKWGIHWAYKPPQKGQLPVNKPPKHFSIQNEIDQFAWQTINEQRLYPNPKANKQTLLRRVSLDLIGLPPTIEEIEDFLADNSPNAFEKVVDRLLASPHFGERWASMWMDLARYGDSQGYQKDPYRSIWMYRDWLIQAFNQNMPFDQFTITQLAGDLLAQPTENQLIATAFHRNTMTNDEGGTDDEEFRVAAVLDRVNTTWEVWQGTTMACVQCHSHPYDPFRHEEFYESYAFFNTSADSDKRDDRPYLLTYPYTQKVKLAKFTSQYPTLPNIEPTMDGRTIDSLKAVIAKMPDKAQWIDSLAFLRKIPTPIMQELPKEATRTAHLFERGNWLVHGQVVYPNLPRSLMAKDNTPTFQNRLDLAKWLVSAENPLTARVIVNRFWAELFGQGMVKTLEDFGTQGALPTHPELLDWLAVHFREDLQWKMKDLLRMMVLSSTYQQSSVTTTTHLKIDPNNNYLARASRVRLSAEQIRDQALAVSGLLSAKMYGPSVMPPQPEGVWQVIRNVLKWRESEGEDRYRRAVYTFWRRSSPYPSFITFDSPSRELCVSRRIRTNTPLQALNTLNDTVYVEAARALGKLMLDFDSNLFAEKLQYGYQRVLGTKANQATINVLMQHYQQYLEYYQQHSALAAKMALTNDNRVASLAAFAVIGNILLNTDAFLVRE